MRRTLHWVNIRPKVNEPTLIRCQVRFIDSTGFAPLRLMLHKTYIGDGEFSDLSITISDYRSGAALLYDFYDSDINEIRKRLNNNTKNALPSIERVNKVRSKIFICGDPEIKIKTIYDCLKLLQKDAILKYGVANRHYKKREP